MGSELLAPLLSAALSGVGTIMSQSSARDAEQKQQRILADADITARKRVQDKNNMIQKFTADTYNPVNRQQSYEAGAKTANAGFLDTIKQANNGSYGEIPTSAQGKLSEDYVKANATQSANAANDIMERARLASRSGAVNSMFMGEDMQQNELDSNIGIADSAINNIEKNGANRANGVRDKGSLLGGLLAGGAPLAGAVFGKKNKTADWTGM